MAALTRDQFLLFNSILLHNTDSARKFMRNLLEQDTSKKNERYVQYYLQKLDEFEEREKNLEIPQNLKGKLVGAFPDPIEMNRYYLTERENEVIHQVERMRTVANKLSDLHIHYNNATLLYGPSGTGKTYLAKYISYQLGLPYYYINFSALIDSYMGDTAKNVEYVFQFVKDRPCVLILDEIDCIVSRRESHGRSGPDGEIERATVTFMQQFDILPNNVTVIATTNRPDAIDKALLRRIPIKHEIKPLSMKEAEDMVLLFYDSINKSHLYDQVYVDKLWDICRNQSDIMTLIVQHLAEQIEKNQFDFDEENKNSDMPRMPRPAFSEPEKEKN